MLISGVVHLNYDIIHSKNRIKQLYQSV
jgi:hypothetical protein